MRTKARKASLRPVPIEPDGTMIVNANLNDVKDEAVL
jgi:hypothetical protein